MANIFGILPRIDALGGADDLWLSDATRHGVIDSNGSISVASFTSAFGLGVAGLPTASLFWNYATTFYAGDANDNVLVAAPGPASHNTLTITYFASSNFRTSYLTSAPKALCVGSFDNYVVAWNVRGSDIYPTRVQWCQRGNPSNWTGEGSGFEDLLEMKGIGNHALGTQDNRLVLFSTQEIWYGLPATYPAQFQFYPLDRGVGLMAPHTAVETDLGIIFLGTDLNIRLLPRGGGPSQIIAPQMREAIQNLTFTTPGTGNNIGFAVFDPHKRLYYLYVDRAAAAGTPTGALVLNVDTGEWGRILHNAVAPKVGCAFQAPSVANITTNVFYANSTGTVTSANSILDTEMGSVVTSTWESAPVAADLHDCYKTLTNAMVAYRSFSTGTAFLRVSQNGGLTYGSSGGTLALATAPRSGRVETQMYVGAALPTVQITSSSTGYELHRLDVQMSVGGRP
jgi:hypothetical protein